MEDLTNAVKKISLETRIVPNKILYISLKFDNESILRILRNFNLSEHDIQEQFHITLLYTGGKENENLIQLIPLFDTIYDIEVNRIAISDKFIVLGVNWTDDIPYYGNEIRHITIGKSNVKKLKLFPKDSPTAFTEGIVMNFEKPYIIKGIIKPVFK